jgi:hypothetical protein
MVCVVLHRVQDLPAVAVKDLRRNELPRVILNRDVPPPLAIMGVMNDCRILTTGTCVLSDWGIWDILSDQARWAVQLSITRDRRSPAGRKRGQLDLQNAKTKKNEQTAQTAKKCANCTNCRKSRK